MSKIIHISGLKGSGKTTAAYLVRDLLGNAEVVHYADLLKDMVATLFDTDRDTIEKLKNGSFVSITGGYTELTTDMRTILQRFGTEVMREMVDKDFWVTAGKRKITNLLENGVDHVIVPDTRFPNEVLEDSITILIKRSGMDVGDLHASETQMNNYNFTFIVENDGTLEELKEKLSDILKVTTNAA